MKPAEQRPGEARRWAWRPFFVGVVLTAVLLPAFTLLAREATYGKLGIFSRVLTLVENNYVEEPDPRTLIYGAIKGMMQTLDAHSVFLTPEEYAQMKAGTDGAFGGVGLEVTRDRDRLIVIAPIEGTPAHRAGLRAGDEIATIDGVPVADLSLSLAVHRLRGPVGSKVVLGLLRDTFTAPREITLVREHIEVNPVTFTRHDDLGVIRIRSFQDRTATYVRRAVEKISKESGGKPGGIVLDLRNNPGGLLDQAVAVSDIWLSEGVIVATRGRTSPEDVQRAHKPRTEGDYPMAVLVNEGTASASEIVAAALREHDRAVLVGTQTFGKGSVQTIIDLDDGSGLKLTIARYYTPDGNSIHGRGIEPDIVVRPEPLAGAGTDDGLGNGALIAAATHDQQLQAALQALRNWDRTRPRPENEKRAGNKKAPRGK
ncbi:MAG: S41 family peptidase [Deltaproteobacteria bacterium]|nr:S41 family peptidase [Deltaproteobacteria bacterium]